MREYRYIGKATSNDRAYGKVTGHAVYTSDMQSVDMLYLAYKPSAVGHGLIASIDASGAWLPGVRAIYTYQNTPDRYFDRGRVSRAEADSVPNQEKLFDREVRFFGERVAAVVAESEETARRACRLIRVEYQPLPLVMTQDEARSDGAPKLHRDGNLYPADGKPYRRTLGNYDGAKADVVVRTAMHAGRMTHMCMETQSVRARFDKSDGRLTVWSGCQTAYGVRSTVADLLGLPYNRVCVVKALMGGSFGVKQEMVLEPLVAFAAFDLRADVLCHFTREEQITGTLLRHDLDCTVETKWTRDGTIQGLKVEMNLDAGAYQTVSPSYLRGIGNKLTKTYRIPNVEYLGQSYCTTTPCNGSFRSWGTAELAIGLEPNLNEAARILGIDPVELRLRNVHQPFDRDRMNRASVSNARCRDVREKGRERCGWDQKVAACRERNRQGGRYRYGCGMALCSHTSSFYPYLNERADCILRMADDGSAILTMPIHDHGGGTVTAMKKICAEALQIDPGRIEVHEADTDVTGYDYGCYASRSVYVFGQAVIRCAEEMIEKGRTLASMLLKCHPETIRYTDGFFSSEMNPKIRKEWREIWEYAVFSRGEDLFCAVTGHASANPGTAAAHFTEVRVDTYTGQVKVLHCLSVHDIGKRINPDLCFGQIGSGIQQGIGWALREEIKIDPKTGQTLITGFRNYEMCNAADMPAYDALFIEDAEPTGPFGAKGLGEVVTAPVAPACVEAVNQALGLHLNRCPLTPPVILEALAGRPDPEAAGFRTAD